MRCASGVVAAWKQRAFGSFCNHPERSDVVRGEARIGTRRAAGGRSMSRNFAIRMEKNGIAATLHVAGALVEGRHAERLLWAVRGLVRRGVTRLVLDLEAVRLIDCAGLGLLVRCGDAARKGGASLRLSGAHGSVGRMLRMSALGEKPLLVSA